MRWYTGDIAVYCGVLRCIAVYCSVIAVYCGVIAVYCWVIAVHQPQLWLVRFVRFVRLQVYIRSVQAAAHRDTLDIGLLVAVV